MYGRHCGLRLRVWQVVTGTGHVSIRWTGRINRVAMYRLSVMARVRIVTNCVL